MPSSKRPHMMDVALIGPMANNTAVCSRDYPMHADRHFSLAKESKEMAKTGIHHVAFACRDIHENHKFYSGILGLKLIKTEVNRYQDGYFRHTFYDAGDGSCIAFFDLHGVGEPEKYSTAISTGLKLPPWVNHLALDTTAEHTQEVIKKLKEAGINTVEEYDHGWCKSTYFPDPNGIMIELCENTSGFEVDEAEAIRMMDLVPDLDQAPKVA